MSGKRNHYRYKLWDKGKIVQYGITKDPERREAEHKNEGKQFSTFGVKGPTVTKESAEKMGRTEIEKLPCTSSGKESEV